MRRIEILSELRYGVSMRTKIASPKKRCLLLEIIGEIKKFESTK